jgi:hypothetical protein
MTEVETLTTQRRNLGHRVSRPIIGAIETSGCLPPSAARERRLSAGAGSVKKGVRACGCFTMGISPDPPPDGNMNSCDPSEARDEHFAICAIFQ